MLATTSTLVALLVTEVPTPFTDLTPKYNFVVAAFVTPAKSTKIEGKFVLTLVP